MTLQEWVNKYWPTITARAAVKVRAERGPTCAYRVDGDAQNMAPENVCFIGACIPPDEYTQDFEGLCVGHSAVLLWDLQRDEDKDALNSLQAIHDYYDPGKWPDELQLWLATHNLTAPLVT